MVNIVHTGDPVLRAKAKDVSDITSVETHDIIARMKKALSNERFGVAIAAPQISESVRIFIVAGKVFAKDDDDEGAGAEEELPDQVFINPKIMKLSKKKQVSNEGCLSVPGKYGTKVERPEKVTIQYIGENGSKFERGASGFLAQVILHEIDHLDGILYTDHALEVIDVDENLKPLNSDDDIATMREERIGN